MIGERLYQLRKDAGLTQDELADILKINKHSISSYERNKSEPPDGIKVRMAKFFNVSIDYMLQVTDNPKPVGEQDHVLRLPTGMPEEAVEELQDFMDFLAKRYKTRRNRRRIQA